MSKHTPGPWTAIDGSLGGSFMVLIPANGMVICSRNPYEDKAEEFAANARLIAAAPTLLEVLESIESMYDHSTSVGELASRLYEAKCLARIAIAKATGERHV